jgi:hypothetical protein
VRILGFLLLFFSCFIANAQFSDSFKSPNLNNWQGDVSKFILENNTLRSNSNTANDAFYISRPSSSNNKEWQLDVELKFNTSSVNYVDFVIAANSANFNDSLLYVRIGNTKDEISLYQNNGASSTLLIDGLDEVTKKSNNTLIVRGRLILDTLYLDYASTFSSPTSFSDLMKVRIDTNSIRYSSTYAGLRIRQSTASFFGDHYFNFMYAGALMTDTAKPEIKNLTVLDSNKLGLLFSEPIQGRILNKLSNFTINTIASNSIQVLGNDSIELTFANPFVSGQETQLSIDSLIDLSNNTSLNINAPFTFLDIQNAAYNDLLITEIYSKPSSSG